MTTPNREIFFIVGIGANDAENQTVLIYCNNAAAASWCSENGGVVLAAGNDLSELFGQYSLLYPVAIGHPVSADAAPGIELPM